MLPDTLAGEVNDAHAWLLQVVADFERGGADWVSYFSHDPMQDIAELNELRDGLVSAGVSVPRMRDMNTDPLGNMMDWRNFLASIVTVH